MISEELLYETKVNRVEEEMIHIMKVIRYTHNSKKKKKLENKLKELSNVRYW